MQITSNSDEVSAHIKDIGKQMPFAISKAINATADKVRNDVLEEAKSTLTLRGSWFNPRTRMGFNVTPSTKGNLTATVFTRADWMVKQEEGGIKTASGLVAVPTINVKRNKKDMVAKGNRPRNIKGAFKVTFKSGKQAIVKAYNADSRKLVVLYWLEKQTRIKGVYKFHDVGISTFKKNIDSDLKDAVDYAMRSAK